MTVIGYVVIEQCEWRNPKLADDRLYSLDTAKGVVAQENSYWGQGRYRYTIAEVREVEEEK